MTVEDLSAWLAPRRGVLSLLWMFLLLLWETWAPFLRQFHGLGQRARHAGVNWLIALFNGIVTAWVFASLWRGGADWARQHGFGLLNATPLPPWLHAIASLLLLDAWTYSWHRLCHRVPILWRFHRVHHSDPAMDVTTANRFHFGEILLSSILRLALVPLLGIRFEHLVLYETLLQVFVQWQHANVGIGRFGERLAALLVVTPGLHKVHHSRFQLETDSNYASLLSCWDRLFGSFRVREDLEAIRFGLEGEDGSDRQTLAALVKAPLRPDHGG